MSNTAACVTDISPDEPFTVTSEGSSLRAMSKKPANQMNALQKLILNRMDELNMNYYDVARAGGFPHHTTVYALVHKKEHKQPPRSETLKRLAKALDVDLSLVRAAASEAAGYKLHDITTTLDASEDVRIVAAAMGELSPADRKLIRMLAVERLKAVRGEEDDSAQA